MTRRAALRLALGSAAPAISRGANRTAGDKPNVLFIWTDEQRADTLATYGNSRFHMPTLNRLAGQSVVFDRCYDSQPVCTPARSTVMSGLWPHTNQCLNNNISLPAHIPLLPELLNDSSYYTGYMGKWHLGDEIFPQHGFQEWISIEDMYHGYFRPDKDRNARSSYHHFLTKLGYKPGKNNFFSRPFAVHLPIEHCKPSFLAAEATRFIFDHRQQPWMLYVNFLEPHMPFYGPLNDYHSEAEAPIPPNYPGAPIEKEPELYVRERRKYHDEGFEGHNLKTREGWARLNRNYAGLCTQVDQAIGRILWALEASGVEGNTILVFTSDHGEMMGAHRLVGKSVLYEEAVRIPLLLRVPYRQQSTMRVNQPVSHISLVPTLLELLGRNAPESLPGESLLPLLYNRQLREDHVFIEWHELPDGPNSRAVVSPEGWKLGLFDHDNSLLFDRNKDPLEMNNLYYRPESEEVIRRLRRKIAAWQRLTDDKIVTLPT